MSPRPGFVLDVDRSTPPTLFWHGERFSLERLPEGSRVIYAPEPVDPLTDPSAAIRAALTHPVGDRDPLPALLRPGMRLTIAFDDISLPLPPMERPDIRQMVIEQVLDMAAEAGVDDVALIVALALHRRMTEAELRHALGDRIYDAFAPNGLLTQHDAEDPDALVHLGLTDQGEDVEINKRAAESDLLVYVNINLVAMDGGHKSVATGLASYKSLRHHHNPQTMQKSRSFMDQHRSELHSSNWRMGRLIADSGVKVFQIETTLNNDTFPPAVPLPPEAGVGVGGQGPPRLPGRLQGPRPDPAPSGPPDLPLGEGTPPDDLGPGRRGRGGPHADHRQRLGPAGGVVEGQTDILTMGLPYISPYNVNSILNPILVACLGLGYFFNLYRGKPLVREGGVLIMTHPTPWEFNPVHHPSYIDFFEQVLSETTDPDRGGRPLRGVLRHRPVVHPPLPDRPRLPRRPSVLHVVLVRPRPPAPGRGHHRRRRPRRRAPARVPGRLHPGRRPGDGPGRGRAVTVPHPSPCPTDPHGRRAVTRQAADPPNSLRPAAGGPDRSPRPWAAARGHDLAGGRSAGSRRRRWPGLGRARFPLAAPSWPESVPRPAPEPELGVHYDTAWSRRYPVRLARAMVLDNVARPLARAVASPLIRGDEGLTGLEGPVIFAANHASHVDTPLLLSCLPLRFRHRTVVAAAADYFFDRRWKADAWSFLLAAIPIERTKVNRRSAELAADLLADGWNLVIFPEGGRSPDGWAQDFPAARPTWPRAPGRPVVPVHLDGTRHILPKGGKGLRRTRTTITFGTPLWPDEGENARRFAVRIETAVATMANEATTDWWTARKQAAAGTTPPLQGPDAAAVATVVDAGRADPGAATATTASTGRGGTAERDAGGSPASATGARSGLHARMTGRAPCRRPRALARRASSSVSSSGASSTGAAMVDRAQPSSRSASAVLRARTGPWR